LCNEDHFIKRDLPPMARRYHEQFHAETRVASDQQPPKATEAAVRRLRTSTQTRSMQMKMTDWIEPAAPAGRDICFRRAASVARHIRLVDMLITRQARPDPGN
jgi:hypothetical protein